MIRQTIILFCFLFFSAVATAAFERPLPAEQVFQLTPKPLNASTLQLTWTIKPGYFLYRDRIQIMPVSLQSAQLGNIHFPDPQIKMTHQNKTILIYRDHLTLDIPFKANTPGEIPLNIHFQGCSDQGFCYPPMNKIVMLAVDKQQRLHHVFVETMMPEQLQSLNVKPLSIDKLKNENEKPLDHKLAKIERLFSSGNTLLIIITFFGFGLLLSFTPCVLPMIPVLSGMIVGHGHSMTTRKAFFLSISYVLSMSVTYSVIGGVIALLGSNLQIQMQSPLAIGCFSLLFVILALSMFGLYDLRLPVSWQNRLARVTRHQSRGHYLNAAIMGSLSILILSPCITPPLLGALSYIAQSGKLSLGLMALFFLGLGMGTPLILVGASAGKFLPKAGKWMNTIKNVFGILLLGVAIHLISRLLAPFYVMVLWSFLLIFSGVAFKPFSRPQTSHENWRQGLGIICLFYGLFILYGASAGHTNPLLPLQQIPIASASEQIVTKMSVHTFAQAEQILSQAKRQHKATMIEFSAEWCESCQIIANSTLNDSRVIHALQGMIWLEIDLTSNNEESLELRHHFQVIAPPTFQFYNAEGEAIKKLQLVGEVPVDTLVKHLQMAQIK